MGLGTRIISYQIPVAFVCHGCLHLSPILVLNKLYSIFCVYKNYPAGWHLRIKHQIMTTL